MKSFVPVLKNPPRLQVSECTNIFLNYVAKKRRFNMKIIILVTIMGALLIPSVAQAKDYRVVAIEKAVKKYWGWIEDPYSGKHYRVNEMDADHIWPKKFGGPDFSWNLVLAGKSENRSKGAKIDSRIFKGYFHKIKALFK